jgi:hypothetical protein
MINWFIFTTDYDEKVLLRYNENNEVLCVPIAEDNRYYQEYLEWTSKGNSPEVVE